MKKVNQEKVIKKKTDQALTIILAGSILLFSAGFLAITSSLKTSAFIKPKNRPSSPNNLQILHVSPQGSTKAPHEAEKIVVIFDRPMSPLQALPQDENDNKFDRLFSFRPQLKIEPKISGKFRWLGSRTLIFTPDNRFPFGTKVKVTIPASMTALDGSTLGYDYSWEFETIRPVVIHHHPEDEGRFIPLQPEILLIFNQPMDIKKASPFIAWESSQSSGKQKISFRLTHPQAERLKEEEFNLPPEYAFILTLEPGFKLTPETEYRISLKKGLTGKEGPLGLEKDFSFSFKTYNYFRFEGIIEVQEDRKRTEKIAESQSTKIFSPDEAIPFKFSNPVAYNEFVSKVKFDPEIKIPEYYFDWEQTHPLIYLSLPLEPETKYRVTIPSELTDEFGNKLGQDFQITFSTGSFPPSVSMTTGHGLIEASIQPSPRYFLSAINQKSVYVQATRLLPETIIPIVRQSDLFRSDKPYLPYPGFYQIEKEYPLDLRPNQKKLLPLNLVELHPSFRRGFVFLQVDKGGRQDHWDRYLKVLLQITELGLSAKFSVENIIIWVTDLRTGLPVKQAQLEIRDEDNNVRWRGETDENGQVEAPGWKKLGLSRDPRRYGPPRLWVLAQHGENVAFISSDWDYGIDPFRFNIPIDWRPEPARFQGYIFTERGIYRAGEVIHVKGVIREKVRGKWQIPQVLRSLNVEIINPLGQSVFKSLLTLDEFGSFNFDYQSSEESALGFYQIRADIPLTKDQRAQFDGSFRIEAFRPVSFEVHIRSDQESYVFGDEFKATVKANYLFGGAMSGQKMEWSLHFDRTFFSPPGHQGFIFGNLIDWDEEITSDEEESRLIASQEEKLDPEGKGLIKLPLVAKKEKDSVRATLEATVTALDRTTVSNRLQTIIHRGEFYIGLRPSTSFLKKGESIKVEVIAVTPGGQLVSGQKINLKLIRREWRSIRQASLRGHWRWRSEPQDLEIESCQITTETQSVKITFKPEKAGFYFFLASSRDNRGNPITTSTCFYVSGNDYVAWEQKEDDTIDLVPNAPSYRPGEISQILVQSPYEKAKALITIEREFILEAKVVDLVGTASTIEIPIKTEYIPNVFVSVLLVQGRKNSPEETEESNDLGIPSFKIGYTILPVDPAEKKLEVKINGLQSEYKPGDKVNLTLKIESLGNPVARASVTLACVDLGVLNLIGYEIPDLFSFFYGHRPLSVRTSETRIHLVNQRQLGEKGEEPGGGGEKAVMAASQTMAEIMLRSDFRPTAYWTPSIITNESGEANVSFILPDNLTTFLVMAVAQTKDSCFGRGEASLRVTKKLMLQPSLPRFCRVGDEFEAGVVVHNFSQNKGEVRLNFECSGLTLLDKIKEHLFPLQAGESREILFRVKAEKAGQASFIFRAVMGQEKDGLQIKIPIHLPRPTETVAVFGQLGAQEKSKQEKIIFPDKVILEASSLNLEAASSALIGLKGSFDSLQNYPYSCLEQKVSAVLPYILAKKLIIDFKLTTLGEKEINDLIDRRLKEIIAYQKETGGFAAWPDFNQTSPFLTCYATFALIKAKEAGFKVNPETINKAADYLLSYGRSEWKQLRQPYGERTFNSIQAYALYILGLLNRPQIALMQKLYDNKSNLSLFGRAYLLKAINQSQTMPLAKEALIKDLLNKIKVTAGEAYFEDDEGLDGRWIFSSPGRTTALILQTLIETKSDHPLLAAVTRWLVNRQMALAKGSFSSTQENFYLFWSLSDFYRLKEREVTDFRARFYLAGKVLLEEKFGPSIKEIKKAQFSLKDLKEKQKLSPGREYFLQMEKEGQGNLYYGIKLNYAPATSFPPRDEGLAVAKRIESLERNEKDGSAGEIKAGSLVVVTLEIAVPQELLYVVIDDPLPAGFEAINPSFRSESEEAWRKLESLIKAEPSRPRPWWAGFNHIERHNDRVILFADSLSPGVYVHRYLARALNFGTYELPGTKAEQMYAPEVFGRGAEMKIKIVR